MKCPLLIRNYLFGKTWRSPGGCRRFQTGTPLTTSSNASHLGRTSIEKRACFRPATASAWGWRGRCCTNPELLILDEPANGLDPAGVVEIRELLVDLAHEKGTTIFMSSHILTEVDRLATRIGIIHNGHLMEELGTEKLDQLRSRRLVIKRGILKQRKLS